MSLEKFVADKEVKKIDGVYVCFFYHGRVILISNPESDLEPKGKAEGDFHLHQQLTTLTLDQLSVVSGGVRYPEQNLSEEEKKTYKLLNLIRETEEETGLILDLTKIKPIENSQTRTIQSRNGKGIYDITGTGYFYELSKNELQTLVRHIILNNRNLVAGTIEEINQAQSSIELRPFVAGIINILSQIEK